MSEQAIALSLDCFFGGGGIRFTDLVYKKGPVMEH